MASKKTKTLFVENIHGRKIRLQKEWAVQTGECYGSGFRIKRADLKMILKNASPYPRIQLYRLIDGALLGNPTYGSVPVVRAAKKLSIGCQRFTKENKNTFIEWATAKA